MALLFADAVAKYNSEIRNEKNEDTVELTNKVADFLDGIEDNTPVSDQYLFIDTQTVKKSLPQSVFMASVASEYYTKAKDDIANTTVGNKAVRKKNFRQVMQESFFYGSNRFGTNFIA
ncbi:MAG: hypothetical protein K6E29_00110 [Cyanobacteria bacterium RUI128]|nr:hypothetical protein [Cyanobacteria bacterium RUI128]